MAAPMFMLNKLFRFLVSMRRANMGYYMQLSIQRLLTATGSEYNETVSKASLELKKKKKKI